MPKAAVEPVVQTTNDLQGAQPATPPKTLTNWRAFEKAGLAPSQIVCQGYKPVHRVDSGCHSRVLLNAAALFAHAVTNDHGGGFQMLVRETSRPWPGWAELERLGLECSDLRCEICDVKVPFHPNHIKTHLKPHSGKSRRIKPGRVFNMTIGVVRPTPDEDEAFEDLG